MTHAERTPSHQYPTPEQMASPSTVGARVELTPEQTEALRQKIVGEASDNGSDLSHMQIAPDFVLFPPRQIQEGAATAVIQEMAVASHDTYPDTGALSVTQLGDSLGAVVGAGPDLTMEELAHRSSRVIGRANELLEQQGSPYRLPHEIMLPEQG